MRTYEKDGHVFGVFALRDGVTVTDDDLRITTSDQRVSRQDYLPVLVFTDLDVEGSRDRLPWFDAESQMLGFEDGKVRLKPRNEG